MFQEKNRTRCSPITDASTVEPKHLPAFEHTAETERRAQEDMRSTMLEVLKEHLAQPAKKLEDVRLDVLEEQPGAPVEESKEESFVQYHVPPSSM